jgi:hypothetical protein
VALVALEVVALVATMLHRRALVMVWQELPTPVAVAEAEAVELASTLA